MSLVVAASNQAATNTPGFRSPVRSSTAAAKCHWLPTVMYAVATCTSVGLAATATAQEAPCDGFSFSQPPFVSPRIIQDLTAWMSDRGEQVVAINLLGSVDSNRYSGEVTTVQRDKSRAPAVVHEDKHACQDQSCSSSVAYFSYQFIGRTPAGVHVLRTADNGGGSGIFQHLLLVTLVADDGFSYDEDERTLTAGRQRCLIKRMEAISLGDRYDGEVSLDGNALRIGADANPRGAGLFPDDVEMIVPDPSGN